MPNDTIRRYWDARSRGYAEATVNDPDPAERRRWKDALEPVLAPLDGAPSIRILDVGCGPGLFAILAAERLPEARITALDGSAGMLAELRRSAEQLGLLDRMDLVEADAEAPLEADAYDAVVTRNVLWNLPNAESALRNWVRALKPGGRILIADGNHYRHLVDPAHRRAVESRPAPRTHAPAYFEGIDPEIMTKEAEKLPLTRELRPAWDERILASEGIVVESLDVSTLPDGQGGEVITDFVLAARKPDEASIR